jgi:Fe-S-cluster containining protein
MGQDDKGCAIVCQRCGRCCRVPSQLVHGDATIQDIARWIGEGRYDILQWVGPIIVRDSEDAMFDIWVNPKTHDFVKRCPWLRRQGGSNVHECLIYNVRPTACREWPANIADGQKGGCPACQEKSPGKAAKGIKVVKPRRDGD